MTADVYTNSCLDRLKRRVLPKLGVIGDRVSAPFTRVEDSILIVGFWRSGTTWLTEIIGQLMGARTVFEPLTQHVPAATFLLGEPYTYDARGFRGAYPYVRPGEPGHERLNSFIVRCLRGAISNTWTNRLTPKTALISRKVVVKMTSGNLLGAHIQQQFGCEAILALRHPCAVAASILRNRWGAWLWQNEFLELFLSQAKLSEDYLSRHEGLIAEYRGNPVNNIALAYSIANLVPLEQAQNGLFSPHLLVYEKIAEDPGVILDMSIDGLHGSLDRLLSIAQVPSATTQRHRHRAGLRNRLWGWQEELPLSDIQMIREIVAKFGDPLASTVLYV